MSSDPTSVGVESRLPDDSDLLPSLASRLQQAVRVMFLCFLAYMPVRLMAGPPEFVPEDAIHALRLLALLGCALALHREPGRVVTLCIGAFAYAVVAVSVSYNGVVRGEFVSNAIVAVAVCLGASAFVPWGVVMQLGITAFTAASLLVAAHFGLGDVFALGKVSTVALVICLSGSIVVASDVTRTRRRLTERLRLAREAEEAERRSHALVESMHQVELRFIAGREASEMFAEMLETLLRLTGSEYGFIGELLVAEDGHRYIRTQAVSDIAWDAPSRALYDAEAPNLEFHNLDNLFGYGVRNRCPVIANEPGKDPRRGGLPGGHPPLEKFLGVPLFVGDGLVGMVGLANRPDGYDEEIVEYLQPLLTSCAQLIRAWRTEREREAAEKAVEDMNTELETRVRQRTADLEAANRNLSRFSASVSHDLRQPVRTVASFSELILQESGDVLNESSHDYLHRIKAAGVRMGHLIDDLLSLTRVARGELRLQDVDVGVLGLEILADFQAASPERRCEVVVDDDLVVRGDEGLLRILLTNLLENAWKYSSPRETTRIELRRERAEREDVFFVRDNGEGFDMRFKDKLFRMFERLHGDATVEGTGIGLATVEAIVQRHGGRVWAEGEINKGATFWVALPRGEEMGSGVEATAGAA